MQNYNTDIVIILIGVMVLSFFVAYFYKKIVALNERMKKKSRRKVAKMENQTEDQTEDDTESKIWILYVAEILITLFVGWIAYEITIIDKVINFKAIEISMAIASVLSLTLIPMFARYLSNYALFWVRPPEKFAVMVIKDNNLQRILMAVTDKRKLKILKKIRTETLNENLFEFVSHGDLVWIGLPWQGYTIQTWYERSRDELNPNADPHCALDLMERIWNFGTEDGLTEVELKDSIAKWGVETRDNIQVTPKLFLIGEVVNPQKTIYNVTYFQEAINMEILAAWKKAVQGLDYFSYREDDKLGQVQDHKNNVQSAAQLEMDILLGFFDENKNRIHVEFLTPKGAIIPISDRNCYPEGSPVRMIYDEYGFLVKRVELRDIDPTDEKIRISIQDIFKAKNKAIEEVETAKGDQQAKIKRTVGDVYRTTELGKADGIATIYRSNGTAKGYELIKEKLKLSDANSALLLTTDMTVKALENADYTYLSGQPGDIGNWAMAAVDRMQGGLDKINSGSDNEASIGFEEIKTAWDGLTDEQKVKLSGIESAGQE